MIHPIGDVQWLDIKTGESHKGMLLELYSMYSERSIQTATGSRIDFNPSEVKITDWMGWSDLLWIERINNVPQTAFVQAGINQLRLHKDALIPCYDPTPLKGFHGETKFLFTVRKLSDLYQHKADTGVLVRTRRNNDEFVPLRIVTMGDSHNSYPFVYNIRTKSGFFNVDNIHMWAYDFIPDDYCTVCPNNGNHQCSQCRPRKFRPHRGTLDEAMSEVFHLRTKNELLHRFQDRLRPYGVEVTSEKLMIKPYGFDERINWDTYIVTLEDFGVLGFTDGPLEER